jgi:hypothetical protein
MTALCIFIYHGRAAMPTAGVLVLWPALAMASCDKS